MNNALTSNFAYGGTSYGISPGESAKSRPVSAGPSNQNNRQENSNLASNHVVVSSPLTVAPPAGMSYARPKSAGTSRPSNPTREKDANDSSASRAAYNYGLSQPRTNLELQQRDKEKQQAQRIPSNNDRPSYDGSSGNATRENAHNSTSSARVSAGLPGSGMKTGADHWTTSYKMFYGNSSNNATAPFSSSGSGSGYAMGNLSAEKFVSSSKTNISLANAARVGVAVVGTDPAQESDLGAGPAPPRSTLAAARIRAAMDHGAKYEAYERPSSAKLASAAAHVDEEDGGDEEGLDAGRIVMGVEDAMEGGLGTEDDDEMDGRPIHETRSHPEVSLPSSSLEFNVDVRNSSLDSFPNDRAAVHLGLSSLPNQYCSIAEALDLRKIIVASKHKSGAMTSSTAVMDMYMVGKVVGVGSYGKVRAAWHRLTASKVAIKTYDKAKFKDPAHWKRVQSEIKIMEQVSHPRIARLYEAVETPKRMHLIMECLDGGNLCSYVKAKRRLSEEESRRIFFQLLQAMEYLHAQSVIHRDIKLENVLFGEGKDVKLIDFGFSTSSQPGKKLRVFCGTPSYMAPEIVRRAEYEGKPVDMWSMGILLYALLCGCFPFRAKSYPDLYRRIARGHFVIPDELSSPVRDLLRQLLALDANNRISAAAAMKHPWLQSQLVSAPDINKLKRECVILISDRASDDLDDQTLCEVERFGIDRDDMVRQVMVKAHSAMTTLYYLLRQKIITNRRLVGNSSGANPVAGAIRRPPQQTGNSIPIKRHLSSSGGYMTAGNGHGGGGGGSVGVGVTGTSGAGMSYGTAQQVVYGQADMINPQLMTGVLNSRPKSASQGRVTLNVARPSSANPASRVSGIRL